MMRQWEMDTTRSICANSRENRAMCWPLIYRKRQFRRRENGWRKICRTVTMPAGDHSIATKPETTIEALRQSLALLKPGGLISLCIYSGGDSGFEEKDAVLAYLRNLDSGDYLVLVTEYYNRPNNPPIPAAVVRIR